MADASNRVMRDWFGWVCAFALAAFPFAGCADGAGNAGTAGMGGSGGVGGLGGTEGMAGSGGMGGHGGAVASGWALSFGGPSLERGDGVAAFSDGTFVTAGTFQESVTFGAGGLNETELVSAGLEDLYFARYDGDGVLAWAKRAGGVDVDHGASVASFADGSFVASGHFARTAIFGPGEPNETELTATPESIPGDLPTDIFIARYNADGTLAWAKSAGGSEWDTSRGAAALSNGSSVITGQFRNTAVFGAGETNETQLTASGPGDIYVARYDRDGLLMWAKRAGGDLASIGNDVASFADDTVAVAGRFEGMATFGAAEIAETELTSRGATDIFVARYDADGSLAWVEQAGGEQVDDAWGVATFDDGASVLTGSFLGTAIFGAGEENETELGDLDIFVARYNADGTLAWAKRAGGTARDVGRDITSMADGSCTVTGRFGDAATFGPGESNATSLVSAGRLDTFVARYAASGELQWATRAGSPSTDSGEAIASLPDGSIVVTGTFEDTTTFFADTVDETELISNGDRDVFLARYELF